MIFAAPEWVGSDWGFKHLVEKYAQPDGFSAVPESEIRAHARHWGKDQRQALARYGWWCESGNRWVS